MCTKGWIYIIWVNGFIFLSFQHAKFKINLVALWTKDGDFELLKEDLVSHASPKGKKSPKVKKSKPAEDEDEELEEDDDDDEEEEEMSE